MRPIWAWIVCAWTPLAGFLIRLLTLPIVLLLAAAALLLAAFSALLVLLLTLIGHHVLLEVRSTITLPSGRTFPIRHMPNRRFPPAWSFEDIGAAFVTPNLSLSIFV
jgi:hypothetical protein